MNEFELSILLWLEANKDKYKNKIPREDLTFDQQLYLVTIMRDNYVSLDKGNIDILTVTQKGTQYIKDIKIKIELEP